MKSLEAAWRGLGIQNPRGLSGDSSLEGKYPAAWCWGERGVWGNSGDSWLTPATHAGRREVRTPGTLVSRDPG